jgi:ParB family chromosome partitioning protein
MGFKPSDDFSSFKGAPPGNVVTYATVSMAEVVAEDGNLQITTRRGVEDLVDSIKKIGLMHAPVLIKNSGAYKIVCGFRRVAACRNLGWSQITAGVLEKTTDRRQMTILAVADNALQRPLNLVEMSRALSLLADVFPDPVRLREAALALGLPPDPAVAAKIMRIGRLPLKIQHAVVAETIGLSMALALGELDQAAAEALVDLFAQLKVGLNSQRELLLLLKEIGSREDRPIQQLLAAKPLQEILMNALLDRAVKRQSVRFYLQQRRYPSISKATADYTMRVKQLKLGKDINLIPPKNFEDAAFTLTLRFHNREELGERKKKIEEIMAHPALAEIIGC